MLHYIYVHFSSIALDEVELEAIPLKDHEAFTYLSVKHQNPFNDFFEDEEKGRTSWRIKIQTFAAFW